MTDPSAYAAPLRVVWLAVCAGATVAVVALGALAMTRPAPVPEWSAGAFYAVALLSAVSLVGAVALMRRMEGRLLQVGSEEKAARTVGLYGIAALAAAQVPALAGALAAFLTGDLLALAFGAPLFVLAWLTWPSDGRVGYWLSLRHR